MHKLLFLISLSLLLFSCNKDRTFHIKAINPVTGQPYSGLEYTIKATKTGVNGENVVYEKSGVLDANGEAYVTVKVKGNRTYNIGCKEPPNTCYTKDIHFTYAIQDEPSPTFQFEYAPCANLKLSIHNINCFDANDQIKFRRLWLDSDEINSFVIVDGCYQFDSDYFSLPNGNYKYEWEVTKNGITNFYDSTFFINENQYFHFTINY